MSLKRIIHEVHRRSIWQVLLIYLGASWFVLQVVDQVQTRLALPEWVYGGAIILLLIGLPIVLATAFVQEGSAPIAANDDASLPHRVLTWRNAMGGGLLAFIGGGAMLVLWLNFVPRDAVQEAAAAQPSIAVLPFVDMSPSKDQEYFGDGITEEILNVLAQVPGLRVPARTSSFSFKGKNLAIKDIAQQLNVAHVLEGSIRKAGDRVRITAQLIDAKTDRHLWSQTYDRNLNDVFAVQDEIAHAIVDALQLQFKQTNAGALVSKETVSGSAHESYLKGLYYWHRRHADEMALGLSHMRQATREDPNYARAWAGLALTYAVIPQYIPSFDRQEAIREGKAAAKRALELDARAADAHAALGQIAQELEWDWNAATQHLDRAVALDPKYATAHQWRAELFAELGRYEDALAEIKQAIEIDPLSSVIQNVHGLVLSLAGRTEEAVPILRSIIERDPGFTFPASTLVQALWRLQRYDEALAAGPDSVGRVITRGIMDPQQRAAALRALADPNFRRGPVFKANAYIALGEPDSAAAALNRGAAVWTSSIAYLARSPTMKPIAQLPAFLEYRRKLRL